MKKIFFSPALLILTFITSFQVTAQVNQPSRNYKIAPGKNFVQSKNYYLITLFEELPEVKKLLSADSVLSAIARNKTDSLNSSLKNCGSDGTCYINSLKFSAEEILQINEELLKLYKSDNALGSLVKNHLQPSGAYILLQQLPAAEMLGKAWTQDAEGINYAIDVYAAGRKPNYPNIDSISFTIQSPNNNGYRNNYVSLLHNVANLVARENDQKPTFFDIPLTAALCFIQINERGQAADFEPMTKGENKSAFERAKAIDWSKWKYTLILIPGAGPDDPSVPLSAEGMIRCQLAAIQYRNGVAPFIVTSGGKVHPYKTKYCEASEMKKYLIENLHIPANAVIIEPHARHTTTNMRNTARIMYRYGFPFNKPAITCTTRGQSSMIENTLIARCMKELHEIPYKNGKRLSETEMEFYPLIEALQINPEEPIDP